MENIRVSRMASVGYRDGFPFRWQDEQSGALVQAVHALWDFALHRTPALSPAQFALVRDYCQYYIFAPVWEFDGAADELTELRERIVGIGTFSELDKWINDCLDVGIDPL